MSEKSITEKKAEFKATRKAIGSRLRELRKGRKLRQRELSAAIGYSRTTISNIENGDEGLTVQILLELCSFYQVSADYILGLSDTPVTKTERLRELEHSLLQISHIAAQVISPKGTTNQDPKQKSGQKHPVHD